MQTQVNGFQEQPTDAGGLGRTPAPEDRLSTIKVEAEPLTVSRVRQPTGLSSVWDQRDIYWIAGIIEGEGTFHHSKYQTKKGINRLYPCVVVEMKDKDVLDRLQSITGMSKVLSSTRPSRPSNWSEMFVWRVNRKADVSRLLLAIYPLMSQRRQAQIKDEVLASW